MLLDECVDRRLAGDIQGHDVKTVPDAGWAALTNGDINVDVKSFAPFVVHPFAPVNFDKQIVKKGDQRQMEAWQRIGTYAAGLALDSAGIKGNAERTRFARRSPRALGRVVEVSSRLLHSVRVNPCRQSCGRGPIAYSSIPATGASRRTFMSSAMTGRRSSG